MGGKSYFCDYCCCFMKNDINVRKLHNSGIAHTICKANYVLRLKDPRTVLMEERLKQPCLRYFSGYCKFELFCKNSHFTKKQLEKLEKLVLTQNRRESRKKQKPRKWPWKTLSQKGLPPSLQPINLTLLKKSNFELNWG
ncbi:uncharacterized protein Dana_GF15171 [Drosophila ananassae]|uniref:C3H1-type domain-containing protein n=1 Tax=Drosophila ananassae TaxID=7217 RepID=B3MNA5_DROAN|nr:zinc finger matrin-type protein 5 [Drosophila ananassae]EDV31062.1 uncharacterized protein Dana_GF15171 [Drosophila ananassae]